ncbi:THO complex subunit 1 [Ischnura elegans]|uniref:THO complex subunit 1 n=1 Tax=Ischnura elegans TaxID=197161 RepID=UPI001ED8A536|nr:THO complex subunit 1 [Ischnura elegans]
MANKLCNFENMRSDFMASVKQCFASGNVEPLQKKYTSINANEADKRSTLDQVMRDYLIQLLSDPKHDVSTWEGFVQFCIKACRSEMCTASIPFSLLGDIFDALTLEHCEKLFAFVENGVNIWREELFFSACKNNLLRMCNDLLRRLSRSQNTVFCGRILLFLAKFFPFSERSGLNVVSEFNLDNITEFGAEDEADLKDILSEKDDTMEDADDKIEPKLKIDYNLYRKFWALQDVFRNPNQCYNKVQWKAFSSHASNVLLAFNSFKLEDLQGKRKRPQANPRDIDAQSPQYFAKFLTNQKLLDLQLSDSNFRRYVLLQFLILFQYLNSSVKFRPETIEMKPEQAEWVKETTDLVYRLLAETPPDGAVFAQAVRHILKREEHWNSWKNEGCPVFQKPNQSAVTSEDSGGDESPLVSDKDGPKDKRKGGGPMRSKFTHKRLGDQIREASTVNRYLMGNVELTRLWNLNPNNLDACKSKERDFLPSLENYFEEAIMQSDPASMIENEYKRVNDGNFGWRALRLLARRSPHFFTHSNNPINKLPEYLETMIKKIAKDRPQVTSSESAKQPTTTSTETAAVNAEPELEDDEVLKTVEKEENRSEVQDLEDGEVVRKESEKISNAQIAAVAEKVAGHWKKLATKLGFQPDEIENLEFSKQSDVAIAHDVLEYWADDDEDAIPENLAYILEGLGLHEAAEALS